MYTTIMSCLESDQCNTKEFCIRKIPNAYNSKQSCMRIRDSIFNYKELRLWKNFTSKNSKIKSIDCGRKDINTMDFV